MPSALSLLAYLAVSFGVVGSMVVGAQILRVRAKIQSPLKPEPYECGETPTGMAWVRFHARYYVLALFFLLFDIEAAFLFPWGNIAREAGPSGLIAVFSFVAVLLLGWVWAIRKGALEWQ